MAYAVVENCPLTLKDWTSRSSLKCSSVNTYHCVADEFSRIVEVCTTPLWIEKGHCPIYNTGAKKMDSIKCSDPHCPRELYTSDKVYKYNCFQQISSRITTETIRTTRPFTSSSNIAAVVVPVIVVFVVLIIIGIIFLRKKRQANKENSGPKELLLNNHQVSDAESEDPKELKVDADFIALCKMHLSKRKTLALLGKLGSGRRTVANQIASRLRKINPKLNIEVLNAFRDIPKDSIMSTIYVLPDLIKSWYTDRHTEDIIQFLQNICSDAENNCFIIASFQYDYWDYSNLELKSQRVHKNILTLFPKPFPVITKIERLREIAMNSENDISDKALKRICEVQTSIGHPLTLIFIMNNKPFSCNEYLIDPISFTMKQLKALEKSDNIRKRIQFKALVFTMLLGGEITHLKLENVLDHTFLVDLKETEDRKETIQECIQQLINVYIKETTDRKSYKMIHDVITKCTFLAAAENHSDLLFSKCHYFPLLECIRHKSTLEKLSFYGKIVYDYENLQFGVPTTFYPKIAEMFVERSDLMDILHTVRFFDNKDFQAVWLKSKDPKLKKVQTEKPPTQ